MCGNSSTTGNNNNSVYKFFKNLKESITKPECVPNIIFKHFVCSICLKKTVEVRTKECTHTTCQRCKPGYCSEECSSTLIETITDCPILQKKFMEGYMLCGMLTPEVFHDLKIAIEK